jgi:hypothetical protein
MPDVSRDICPTFREMYARRFERCMPDVSRDVCPTFREIYARRFERCMPDVSRDICPTFRESIVVRFSSVETLVLYSSLETRLLKMRSPHCLETWDASHPGTRCHTSEEGRSQLHRCEKLAYGCSCWEFGDVEPHLWEDF